DQHQHAEHRQNADPAAGPRPRRIEHGMCAHLSSPPLSAVVPRCGTLCPQWHSAYLRGGSSHSAPLSAMRAVVPRCGTARSSPSPRGGSSHSALLSAMRAVVPRYGTARSSPSLRGGSSHSSVHPPFLLCCCAQAGGAERDRSVEGRRHG